MGPVQLICLGAGTLGWKVLINESRANPAVSPSVEKEETRPVPWAMAEP